jgi:hypothetical protein
MGILRTKSLNSRGGAVPHRKKIVLSMPPLKGGMDNRQPSALGSLLEIATRACSSQTKR